MLIFLMNMKKINSFENYPFIIITFLVPLLLLNGCATLYSRYSSSISNDSPTKMKNSRLFEGTRVDISGLGADNVAIIALADLPLSLALDTLIFPLTFYEQFIKGRIPRAASKGQLTKVGTYLSNGVNVDSRDGQGRTALMNAAIKGHVEIVQLLIEKGANINIKTPVSGYTPIMFAAFGNSESIVSNLISAGADLHAIGKSGESALTYSAWNGNKEITKLLIDNIVNSVGQVKFSGDLAASLAIAKNHYEILRMLLESKIEVLDKGTLLVRSSWIGNLDILKELLAHGVDVNARDAYGQLGLLEAVRGGHLSFVDYLLSQGANAALKDLNGNGIEEYADMYSRGCDKQFKQELLDILEKYSKPNMGATQ